MKIYGLCGRKQAGKDTFANFAKDLLPSLKVGKAALADPLKEFCISFLGLDRDSCYGSDIDKNKYVSTWGLVFNQKLAAKYNKAPNDPISGREILQVVGTDVFRECFRTTFWVDIMINRTIPAAAESGVDVLFVTDVRFANEVRVLKENGGKIIKINRDCQRNDQIQHKSELELMGIPDSEFHRVIDASMNTSLDSLMDEVVKFLQAEGLMVAF